MEREAADQRGLINLGPFGYVPAAAREISEDDAGAVERDIIKGVIRRGSPRKH